MQTSLRLHLAAAGLFGLLISVVALFWSYPKLLVYVLLAIVAVLAYGALYLILAAGLDPRRKPERQEDPPTEPAGKRLAAKATKKRRKRPNKSKSASTTRAKSGRSQLKRTGRSRPSTPEATHEPIPDGDGADDTQLGPPGSTDKEPTP